MNDNEFFLRQQDAVERMREMNSRAVSGSTGSRQSHMPPVPPFVKIPGQENGHSENRQRPAPKHQKPEPYEDGCSGAYGYSPHEKPERQSSYNTKESHGRPAGGNTLNGYTHHGIHQPRSETAARPVPEKTEEQGENNRSLLSGLNLPFLDIFKKDSDMTLIIGLLLILISEKADKKLLFALIYILM